MKGGKRLIFVIGFGILTTTVLFLGYKVLFASGDVKIEVDRESYRTGDLMRVRIKNNFFGKEICLSSCYPYFIQKKNGNWAEFSYKECGHKDRIIKCISPAEEKIFETKVLSPFEGVYRISVPVCRDCNLGTVFQEDDRFYSEDFKIK